jgi:hypothetical protein
VKCNCPNCDWSGDTSELYPVGIEVFQRIEPGDTFPNGECPECDALVSIAEPLRDAAPDLLKALDGLVADWERVTGRRIPDDHEAKAAIAKAQGGAK